jgi:hypothetical protein
MTVDETLIVPSSSSSPFTFDKSSVLDKIQFRRNEIKDAIQNNSPIDDVLHVVAVLSNPCQYKKRVSLMRDFMRRMEFENHVVLYIVELAYGNQPFSITSPLCPRHLQLRTSVPLWHKENMINIGIRQLLPPDWKAVAWIDSDIDFENHSWAIDCLKILNGCRDIVQLFSHALDMDTQQEVMNIFNSFSFKYEREMPYNHKPNNYWHPGYAWACNRTAFERMGGLFDLGILGSGDHIMSFCFTHRGILSIISDFHPEYKQAVLDYQQKVKSLRLGYVPGVIRHFFHGSKINRKYIERNQILLKYSWRPSMVTRDSNGLLQPKPVFFPVEFQSEIMNYFLQRNEDE